MEKYISIKTKEGITMISLIVTIIILLILAGVTIAMLTNSGIIDKANDAAKLTNLAEIREQLGLDILDKQSELMSGEEKRGELTQKELEDIIEKYGELQEDGDTIVTEYGNISLKEIMSGDVKLADTSTSGNESSSEEVSELKQQIEDLKKQMETENNNLQNKITDLENKLKESEVETVLYSGPKTVLDFGASTIVNLSDDLTKYKNLRLTFWTNVEYAEMTINVDNFVKNKDKSFMHYLQSWQTSYGDTRIEYQSFGAVKYASDTSIQVVQAFNNANWRLSLVEVVGVGQK